MDTDLAETEARLRPQVVTGQIIAGVLILGVLLFGAFVAASNANREAGPGGLDLEGGVALDGAEADVVGGELDADLDPGDPILSYVALGFGADAARSQAGRLAGRERRRVGQ